MLEGCRFDERAGQFVVNFFNEFLVHTLGQWAGQPFALLDWQREEVVMPLFGWKRPDGTRRFRRAYIEVPKKNGKSTLCGGLALFLLVADGEPRDKSTELRRIGSRRGSSSVRRPTWWRPPANWVSAWR